MRTILLTTEGGRQGRMEVGLESLVILVAAVDLVTVPVDKEDTDGVMNWALKMEVLTSLQVDWEAFHYPPTLPKTNCF